MALIKSALITQGSGSIGGQTLSHNRGGLYLRARTIPVDPGTTQQRKVRSALAARVANWVNIITPTQRAAWDLYAFNVPLPGPLGDLRNVGGLGMFIRANVVANQFTFPVIADAPTFFNLGSFTQTSLVPPTESTQTIDVAFDNTDDWATENGSGLGIWISRPQNTSINFFKGPYRFAAVIAGADPIAPTSPETVAVPFPFVEGQKLFVQVRALRVDGRLSNLDRQEATAVA